MEALIFDTSVWINFSRGIENKQTELLETYLKQHASFIVLTPTIMQEFLMGISNPTDFNFYEFHFSKLICLRNHWLEYSILAAKLYNDLRKKGITIRKSSDCLIATIAIENGISLVHNDSDFDLISQGSLLNILNPD